MKCSYLAHGKVILIGEHSVVYGYDALAMPIMALQIKASVESSAKMWMDTARYHGPFFTAPDEYGGLKYVVKTMQTKAHCSQPLKLTYTGEIPMKRGFGSSATVALATTKALNQYFALELADEEIMAITNHAEMINHGKASGLDAATVNSDYLVFFNQKMGPKTLNAKLNATLLIMDTGELGSTKQAVNQVYEQIKASPSKKAQIARLGELADQTKTAWLAQDQAAVGQIFNQAQTILQSFALATTKIDQLQKIALTNGALGFKLSGSGLGGIVLALCNDDQTAKQIADKCDSLITGSWIEEI
ncbi:mevalonate kinase [Lactobacillus sp. ESL0785]|uniref:mevalonate kinase n=1 Tax=Lactobacillus sp. ESL0785 TaxID=2983232 RepID=UPI0023F7D664|nr:mevalonate kinase [Lactobacillus sp. ESL0785]WEV70180.1 mevalonate kinase [Lactobacillus sp. ESL0785]